MRADGACISGAASREGATQDGEARERSCLECYHLAQQNLHLYVVSVFQHLDVGATARLPFSLVSIRIIKLHASLHWDRDLTGPVESCSPLKAQIIMCLNGIGRPLRDEYILSGGELFSSGWTCRSTSPSTLCPWHLFPGQQSKYKSKS